MEVKPGASFSAAVLTPPNASWLHISGQVSEAPTIEAQITECWEKLVAVLAEAGMNVADLVKVNAYLTDRADMEILRSVRERFLGAARPASTVVVVAGLARPAVMFELEAVAARANQKSPS